MCEDVDFSEWLRKKTREKNLSQAELSRKSGISESQISRVIAGSKPGGDFLIGMALGLDIPIVEVLRAAKLIPSIPSDDALMEQITSDLSRLSERRRRQAMDFIRFLAQQQTEEGGETAP